MSGYPAFFMGLSLFSALIAIVSSLYSRVIKLEAKLKELQVLPKDYK
jgi:hypothetical protein